MKKEAIKTSNQQKNDKKTVSKKEKIIKKTVKSKEKNKILWQQKKQVDHHEMDEIVQVVD